MPFTFCCVFFQRLSLQDVRIYLEVAQVVVVVIVRDVSNYAVAVIVFVLTIDVAVINNFIVYISILAWSLLMMEPVVGTCFL